MTKMVHGAIVMNGHAALTLCSTMQTVPFVVEPCMSTHMSNSGSKWTGCGNWQSLYTRWVKKFYHPHWGFRTAENFRSTLHVPVVCLYLH